MLWAIACAEHVMPLAREALPGLLAEALSVARGWAAGARPTGDVISAARAVHRLAREIGDPATRAIARAVGHAVATGHMADHSVAAAVYALKAVAASGGAVADEISWQHAELPEKFRPQVEALRSARDPLWRAQHH